MCDTTEGAAPPSPPMIAWREMLAIESVRAGRKAATKKAALEAASEAIAAARPQFDARELLEALLARERLGSTGLGDGVAIPHCRLRGCERPAAALLSLSQPVNFDALDGALVDLLFALVVPEREPQRHLHVLASLAAAFEQPRQRAALRRAADDAALLSAWLAIVEAGA